MPPVHSHPDGKIIAKLEYLNPGFFKERSDGRAFRADQFHHADNFRAHYLHTGPEILAQSGHNIDAFCDFVGTGRTFAGCSAAFKEADTPIRCYVVEPTGCAVLAGDPVREPRHAIQDGG